MKNRLYSIAIFVITLIPFVGSWEGASPVATDPTKGILIELAVTQATASFMPVLDWDMSDLDVRDSHNQPIKDSAADQNLTELFINNLFQLAITNDLHGIRQNYTDINVFSRLFHSLFYNVLYPLERAIQEAIQPPSKRFVHNVHNLWISLSVGIFLSCLMALRFRTKTSSMALVLRC